MIGQAIVAVVVLLSVLVGAWLTIVIQGGDAGLVGTAGAAAGALLGGLVTAELVRSRRDR